MPKLNYYLSNKPTKSGECAIMLWVHFGKERITLSVKDNIVPKNWNPNEQRAKKSSIGASSLNDKLDKIEKEVKEIFRSDLFMVQTPDPIKVKTKIHDTLFPKSNPSNIKDDSKSFYLFLDSFIKEVNKTPRTIKNYNGTINYLKAYEQAQRLKRPLNFLDFDLDFYEKFTSFLTKDKNLAKNSIGVHQKNIKVFLKQSEERGLHNNQVYKSSYFKVESEKAESISLNENELESIYKLNLTGSNLESTRDFFIISCWTGLRYSDLSQVTKDRMIGGYLKIRTIKTKEFVTIPLNDKVLAIMEKYNWQLPKPVVNQVFNRHLKEIAKKAEIIHKVSKDITKGGKKKTTVFNKFELVTVHTARRSFATNMYLRKCPTITIMAITGHKTESSFMKYIKVTQESHAEKMMEYFK